MRRSLEVGDCYIIPLPNGRYGYCQYIHWNERLGCLVRVFDHITSKPESSVEQLQGVADLFPPVFVGLRASVRSGRWKRIGSLPVKHFRFPEFRATSATKPGEYDNWWIWDGEHDRFIGKLPTEFRSLERKVVWGDELLEQRIATGEDPFAGIR